MKISKLFLALGLLTAGSASAQDLFYGGEYDGNFLTVGVRVGLNRSNVTSPSEGKVLNSDSWGTGFDAGVVADIRLRDWFAIQPGFFFQSRSHNYDYVYSTEFFPSIGAGKEYEEGHTRRTLFKVPVLFSLRLHPAEWGELSVDLGPVFNFGLGGHSWYNYPLADPDIELKSKYYDEYNSFMMGMKMGAGMRVFDHYYVGVHYEAGLRSALKQGAGGRDKAWTFTLGYDF